MSADGTWNITLLTPMGPQKMTLTVTTDGDTFTGQSGSPMGAQDVSGKIEQNTLTWTTEVTTPVKLTIDFTATVDGDKISGSCKLGMFGKAKLTGQRG